MFGKRKTFTKYSVMKKEYSYQQKLLNAITLSKAEMFTSILLKVNLILKGEKISEVSGLYHDNISTALLYSGWNCRGSSSIVDLYEPSVFIFTRGKLIIEGTWKRNKPGALLLENQELETIKKVYYAFTKSTYRCEFKTRRKMTTIIRNGKPTRWPERYVGYTKKHPLLASTG